MEPQRDRVSLTGVFRKGYGIVSKAVLHDLELTLESKAIYAYLCALAGSDGETFPFRDTILRELNLSKNTYYRHYRPLVEKGYLSVRRPEDKSAANIYTLCHDKSDGYGRIPRAVMVDPRLSAKAKGLYAYLCAYAGATGRAFPRKTDMLYHLSISEPTCRKILQQLQETGYLAAVQRREEGRFAVNDYFLLGYGSSPQTKKWDTTNRDKKAGDAKKRAASSKIKSPSTSFSNPSPSTGRTRTAKLLDELRERCQTAPVEQQALLLQCTRSLEDLLRHPGRCRATAAQDALQWTKSQLDKPDAADALWEALTAFCDHFQAKQAGKRVRSLPAYLGVSLVNWLAEQPLRQSPGLTLIPGRGGGPPASYDLDEIARFVESGVGL